MRNEIGFMEEHVEAMVGQQLHLEVEGQGVFDYETVKLFELDGVPYLLCLRLSDGREGYLLRMDDLGDSWWTVRDITEDAEWERARDASGYPEYTNVLHR